MNCRALRKKIHRQAEEILTGRWDDEIEEHLKSCLECSRLVRQFQQAWLTIESREPIGPSPHWRTRLRQAIAEQEKATPVLSWLGEPARILRPALAVGVFLIAVIFGQFLAGLSGLADGSDPQSAETASQLAESFSSYYLNVFNAMPEGSMEESYLSLAIDS